MNDILKQRLVGALILVALGVVFWPIIFVEPPSTALDEIAHIPIRPSVDTTAIEPPSKEGLRGSPPLASKKAELEELPQEPAAESAATGAPTVTAQAPAPSEKPRGTRSQAPVKPTIDSDGVPIGWILQVASVSDPTKANALRLRLIDMGYKAYLKKVRRGDTVLLRVYVGPKFERAGLEAMQPKIDAEFKVKSMVRRYIP